MSVPRHIHSLLAVVVPVLFLFFAAAAAAATIGVNSDITWGIPTTAISQEVALTKQAGITWIRASVDLSQADPTVPGQLDPAYVSAIDSELAVARQAGLNVLLEFDRTPYWASADPSKYSDTTGAHWNRYWQYANPQDYAAITAALARHFATLGIDTFELWNEPNNPSFWPSGPSSAGYTALLRAAYPAIKAADASATVVMGGLSNKGSYAFLGGMYAAGVKGYYDIANFHVYPEGDPAMCETVNGRPYEGSFCLLDGLRSVMTANGDSSPVWVTELGWSTCTQSTYCYTADQQATWLSAAYHRLDGGGYPWVTAAFVYQMRDLYWDTSNTDWASSLGLLTRDFTPKPAYGALSAIAAGAPAPAPNPTITITAPSAGAYVANGMTAAASVSGFTGATVASFAVDGAVRATSSSAPYAASISTRKLAAGSHVLTVTARDAAGQTRAASKTFRTGTKPATATVANVSSLTLTVRRRHGVLLLRGRLVSAVPGESRVIVAAYQRRVGRWTRRSQRAVRTDRHGHFKLRLSVRRGRWRIVASGAGRTARRVVRVADRRH